MHPVVGAVCAAILACMCWWQLNPNPTLTPWQLWCESCERAIDCCGVDYLCCRVVYVKARLSWQVLTVEAKCCWRNLMPAAVTKPPQPNQPRASFMAHVKHTQQCVLCC